MAGCGRISELPESLLTQILSYLPTKDSVKTSLLSKRWKFVWLRVPGLDLRFNDFPEVFPPAEQALESFVNKFLEFNKDSRMQTFKIQYEYEQCDDDQLVVWIDKAVDRGVQHLYVETEKAPNITQSIYRSNTLVSLTLLSVGLESPKSVVSLPCLKMMHIEDVWYDYDDPLIMEKIISGCPALEELSVIRPVDSYNADVVKFLRVRSQTLKRFCLMFENCWGGTDFSVEIDAPSLEYMSFRDDQSDVIVVKNLTSLYMIDIDSEFNVKFGGSPLEPDDSSKKDTIHEFFSEFLFGVRHMIISRPTVEVLYQYSKMGSIPKFINLYRLYAAFSCFTLQLLPIFLESCPKLKDLILDYTVVSAQPDEIELSYVPRCLTSSLERVYINKLIMKEETGVRLVNYFLENSAVLKELTVSFTDSPVSNQERDIYKNLLTANKLSRRCQVSIC